MYVAFVACQGRKKKLGFFLDVVDPEFTKSIENFILSFLFFILFPLFEAF